MAPRYRTVIFDLDGTIADTLPLIYEAFNAALEPVTGQRLGEFEIRALFGPPDNWIIRDYVGEAEYAAAFARYLTIYELEHHRLAGLHSGMDDLIRACKAAGMTLGVVTGKSRQTALLTLELVGVLDQFGAIYAGDDVSKQKPDPEAIFAILRDLNHPDGAPGVIIGDSAADILAGHAAGLTSLAVTWGSPDHADLFAAKPDGICATTEELAEALGVTLSPSAD
jgi:phosphoglycolate phosphatase/pyrophosphatase PpaX